MFEGLVPVKNITYGRNEHLNNLRSSQQNWVKFNI